MPTFEFTSPEGKKYRVTAPEGATREQAFDILQGQISQQRPPGTPLAEQVGRGLVRGIAGVASSIPDPTRYLMPQRAREQIERGQAEVRQFATAPAESAWESGGRFVGGALPFVAQPELGLFGLGARAAAVPLVGRFAPAIGGLAERSAQGAIAGALQPGEDKVTEAEAGALAAGAAGVLGRAGIPVSRMAGWISKHGVTGAMISAAGFLGMNPHTFMWWFALHNNPLSRAAGAIVRGATRLPTKVMETMPPSLLGSIAGQTVGGGRDGQTQAPRPTDRPRPLERERAPIQADFEALGSAGGRGQPERNNNPPADQRADRRWEDPNYFRQSP